MVIILKFKKYVESTKQCNEKINRFAKQNINRKRINGDVRNN